MSPAVFCASADFDRSCTEQVSVEEALTYNLYLSAPGEQRLELDFQLAAGAALKLVLFDLEPHDTELKVRVNAPAHTSVEIFLGAQTNGAHRKNFCFDIVNEGRGGQSFVKMYGVAADRGQMTFSGSTRIVSGAKRCKVRQEGRIINLSPSVKTQVSPQLLIEENDIEASHGAVLGAIPDAVLFYLMSRGLGRREVERLLARGSFGPLLGELESAEVRSRVLSALGEEAN